MRSPRHTHVFGLDSCDFGLQDRRYLCFLLTLLAFSGSSTAAFGERFERLGELRLPPHSERTIAWLEGPARLDRFRIEAGESDFRRDRLLLVALYWDEATSPGVFGPWSDLCSRRLDDRPVSVPWMASDRTGAEVRFPMPFRSSARIVLRNDDSRPRDVHFRLEGELLSGTGPVAYFHAATRFSSAREEVSLSGIVHWFGWSGVGRADLPSTPSCRSIEPATADPFSSPTLEAARHESRGLAETRQLFIPPQGIEGRLLWAPTPGRESAWTCYWSDSRPDLPAGLSSAPPRGQRTVPVPHDRPGFEAELLHPTAFAAARVIGDADVSVRYSGGRALALGPCERETDIDLALPERSAGLYRLVLHTRTRPSVRVQVSIDGRPFDPPIRCGEGSVDVGWIRLLDQSSTLTIRMPSNRRLLLDRLELEAAPRRRHALEAEDWPPIQTRLTRRDDGRLPLSGRSQILWNGRGDWKLPLPVVRPGRFLVRLYLTEGPDRADIQIEHQHRVLGRFAGRSAVERGAAPLVLGPVSLGPGDATITLRVVSPDRSVIGLDALSIWDFDRRTWITPPGGIR